MVDSGCLGSMEWELLLVCCVFLRSSTRGFCQGISKENPKGNFISLSFREATAVSFLMASQPGSSSRPAIRALFLKGGKVREGMMIGHDGMALFFGRLDS